MFTLRVPVSALGGALLSGALFLVLWQLVEVPMIARPTATVIRPELARVRPATSPASKRQEKPKRNQPVLPPGPPRIFGGGETSVGATPYKAPPLTVGLERGARGTHGIDGDVVPIVRPNPEYPPREIIRGTEGWVRVQFSVTSIGTVRDAVVIDSEPGTVFDEAALKAIARWRYNPRVENGEAVERVGLQTIIRFELEN